MTILKNFVPLGVKKAVLVSFALLALYVVGSHLNVALRTGVVQRLSDTPKYTRGENPGMFWLSVIFLGASALLFAALLTAVISHWDDDKIF